MLRKALIPAAGLGTRLLPATKEQPKEMLPIFARDLNGQPRLKPLLQLIFEQLYDAGFKEFCFITGRGKRAIEDHFTEDHEFILDLKERNKLQQALNMESFYRRINGSTIVWVNQPEPRGLGDAVLKGKAFIANQSFLVHAGDTYIISRRNNHLERLLDCWLKLDADALFLVQEVADPRAYGVVEVERENGQLLVKNALEKPQDPPTNLAIMPIYAFRPKILESLERSGAGLGGELWLTDAIKSLIEQGGRVYAVPLSRDEVRLDVGSPELYLEALVTSYDCADA